MTIRTTLPPMLLLFVVACDGADGDTGKPAQDTHEELVDADGDGVPVGADCDDADPYSYPGAGEIPYDGVDQDCDGVDVNDSDGDGYVGVGGGGDDCNDGNPTVHPGAAVVCYDLLDETCADESWSQYDCDSDGFERSEDCGDEDTTVFPGAPDTWYDGIDSDCDGRDDFDQDEDGEAAAESGGTDCDDLDAAVSTAAGESWDGRDDDCSGAADDLTSLNTSSRWYGDDTEASLFAYDFAPVGDLDGDGRTDVLVGVPGYGESIGRAYVLPYGEGLGDPEGSALAMIDGAAGYFGATVSAPLEGLDEAAHVAVGEPGAQSVYLFDIAALTGGAALTTADAVATITSDTWPLGGDLAPWAAAAHAPALLVSSFEGAGIGGYVGLFPTAGLTGSVTTDAAAWSVETSGDLYDAAVLGDLDGDDVAEIGAATSGFDDNPRTYVYAGAAVSAGDTTGASLTGFTGHLLLASAPDLDGDGYAEVLVSDVEHDGTGTLTGRVWVVGGPAALTGGDVATQAFATVSGVTDGGRLQAASTHVDLDGDARIDLFVCAPGDGLSALNGACGWVGGPALVGGGDHAPGTAGPTFTSEATDDRFGADALFDDVDADGDPDLWISSPMSSGGLLLYLNR